MCFVRVSWCMFFIIWFLVVWRFIGWFWKVRRRFLKWLMNVIFLLRWWCLWIFWIMWLLFRLWCLVSCFVFLIRFICVSCRIIFCWFWFCWLSLVFVCISVLMRLRCFFWRMLFIVWCVICWFLLFMCWGRIVGWKFWWLSNWWLVICWFSWKFFCGLCIVLVMRVLFVLMVVKLVFLIVNVWSVLSE